MCWNVIWFEESVEPLDNSIFNNDFLTLSINQKPYQAISMIVCFILVQNIFGTTERLKLMEGFKNYDCFKYFFYNINP